MTKPAKKSIAFWWPRDWEHTIQNEGSIKAIKIKEDAEDIWGRNNVVKMRIEEVGE